MTCLVPQFKCPSPFNHHHGIVYYLCSYDHLTPIITTCSVCSKIIPFLVALWSLKQNKRYPYPCWPISCPMSKCTPPVCDIAHVRSTIETFSYLSSSEHITRVVLFIAHPAGKLRGTGNLRNHCVSSQMAAVIDFDTTRVPTLEPRTTSSAVPRPLSYVGAIGPPAKVRIGL